MPRIERFLWSRGVSRYRDRQTGRFVSGREVRAALDVALHNTASRARFLALGLQARRISVGEWERGMERLIRSAHLYSAALAGGGWDKLEAGDLSALGALVEEQLVYLRRFAGELRGGLARDGRMLVRAGMYINAARQTFHIFQRRDLLIQGHYREERNILHPADHCDGCLEATDQDWVPLGSLPLVGERDCLTNCKCTIEYR